jgi:putative Mn2+ efflux pump MntP
MDFSLVLASPIIGIVSFGITLLGFQVGKRAGKLMGKRAEIAGGVILIGIAIRILLSHIL